MTSAVKLTYKASNIAKAEEATGRNFFTALELIGKNPSFSDLHFLVIAGGGSDEDFDNLFASGIEKLMLTILEGIENAGFLGESSKGALEQAKRALKTEATETTPTSGEATKK